MFHKLVFRKRPRKIVYLKTYLSNTPNTVDQIQIQIQIHGLKFDQIQIQIQIRRICICICICKYKYVFDPSPDIKLCAAFQIHRWIQTGVTVRKCPILVKISNFLSRMTLKFDGWLWKTIGQFSYAASRFVHHFIAIGELKLELQSGNSRFGSKSSTFCPVWPWNLTYDLEKQ